MARNTKYETTDICEFIRAIMKSADTKAQEKGITNEAQAYYIGVYNTANAIFQALISTGNKCTVSLDYKKGIASYKEMIERDKELDRNPYHQISFDELFPEVMRTMDRLNKYLDKEEKE